MIGAAKQAYYKSKSENPADFCTKAGAEVLAKKIETFWANQGCKVTMRIELQDTWYMVRSDMVNGYPRDYAE